MGTLHWREKKKHSAQNNLENTPCELIWKTPHRGDAQKENQNKHLYKLTEKFSKRIYTRKLQTGKF